MPTPDHSDTDHVRIGGLMRCCTATIGDMYPNGPAKIATEGQTLRCKFVDGPNHAMIFREGAWEWDQHPAEPAELPDTMPPPEDAAADLPTDQAEPTELPPEADAPVIP